MTERTPDLPSRLLEEIRARQNGRRQPAVGTCAVCGHRQPMMPSNQPCPSSLAEAQWKCQKCGGQIIVTVMIGGLGPTADDDIDTLLDLLRAAAQSLTDSEAERDEARKLAREAVNTWACVARSKRDHAAIADYHAKLDAMEKP